MFNSHHVKLACLFSSGTNKGFLFTLLPHILFLTILCKLKRLLSGTNHHVTFRHLNPLSSWVVRFIQLVTMTKGFELLPCNWLICCLVEIIQWGCIRGESRIPNNCTQVREALFQNIFTHVKINCSHPRNYSIVIQYLVKRLLKYWVTEQNNHLI